MECRSISRGQTNTKTFRSQGPAVAWHMGIGINQIRCNLDPRKKPSHWYIFQYFFEESDQYGHLSLYDFTRSYVNLLLWRHEPQ